MTNNCYFYFDRSHKIDTENGLCVSSSEFRENTGKSAKYPEYASLNSNSTDSGNVTGTEPRKSAVDVSYMDAMLQPSNKSRRWRTAPNSEFFFLEI